MWDEMGNKVGELGDRSWKDVETLGKSLQQFIPSFLRHKGRCSPRGGADYQQGPLQPSFTELQREVLAPLQDMEVSTGSTALPNPTSLGFTLHGVFQGLRWHFSLNTKWWLRTNRSVDNCLLRRQPLVWQIRVGCWIVQHSWARQLGNSTYHCAGQLIHFLVLSCQAGYYMPNQSYPQSKQARESVCSSGQCTRYSGMSYLLPPPASFVSYNSIMQEYTTFLRLFILAIYSTLRA